METFIVFAYNNWGTILPIVVTDTGEYADAEAGEWEKKMGMGWHTVVMPVRHSFSTDFIFDLANSEDELCVTREEG